MESREISQFYVFSRTIGARRSTGCKSPNLDRHSNDWSIKEEKLCLVDGLVAKRSLTSVPRRRLYLLLLTVKFCGSAVAE
jgi:hypothetical protein